MNEAKLKDLRITFFFIYYNFIVSLIRAENGEMLLKEIKFICSGLSGILNSNKSHTEFYISLFNKLCLVKTH